MTKAHSADEGNPANSRRGNVRAERPHGTADDNDALSYEAARAELAEVVGKLESGAGSLEEALALWERGEVLAGICQARLDGARARLDAARPQPA